MKTSALVPVVAYLGLAGLSSAAPVAIDAEKSLDKRFFCVFGFGWGCNQPTTTSTSVAPAKTSTASSVVSSVAKQSAVTSSSAVKSSAAVSSSAKASSAVAAPSSTSSAKSAATTSATKSASASWAQCTDFDWSAWNDKEWQWGGGFNKEYVQNWYLDNYGLNPIPGMNWRQVSSLVSKFGAKTTVSGPKTTSKYSKGCSNPWTSAAPVTKTKAATTTTAKPVTPIPTSTKPVVTSASASKASSVANSSSASASKPVSSSAAASASSAKASSSSVVVGGPAPSASSAAGTPASASSAAGTSASASSAAGVSASASSAAGVSSASSSPSATVPVVGGGASPSASSPAVEVPSVSASPVTPSPSAGPVDGSNGTPTGTPGSGTGVPGTGAGVPGTGEGSNNGTSTSVEQPQPTVVAPVTVNGYTYGGCAQEVAGRLLEKVQTSSAAQTIESCTALCASYGFGVAGLEYGNECYCGTLDDVEDAEISGECYMPCAGNSDQICGGPNAINWYFDEDKMPVSTAILPNEWTTYGVVSEGTHGRLLSTLLYASQDNTVEKCAQGCAAAGYKVAGTEYSAECFCGNGFTSGVGGGELLDDSAAFMACSGNLAQKCGGPSILSVTSAFGDDIPFI